MTEDDRQTLVSWAALDQQLRSLIASAVAEDGEASAAVLTLANLVADIIASAPSADAFEAELDLFRRMVTDFAREKFLARQPAAGTS